MNVTRSHVAARENTRPPGSADPPTAAIRPRRGTGARSGVCYSAGMDPGPPALIADDLAPGDTAAVELDWSGLALTRIRRPDHPLFEPAYQRLWEEFGARGEMERRSAIEARLGWHPLRPIA